MTHYTTLLEKIQEINDLEKATAVLGWDREVMMPKGGATARIQQITTLRQLSHSLFIADEIGELIEATAAELDGAGYESQEASLVRVLRRDYDRARKLPPEFVARMSTISGQARVVWVKARQDNDFASFRPWLEQVVGLAQEMAELYGYQDEKYDALLDNYEPGVKTADVRAIFSTVKEALVPLRQAIVERGAPVDDALLHQSYDVEKQKAFAHHIAAAVGYDFERGHLGTAVHPFATSFSRDDVRITTRWNPNFLNESLFGTLHEAGHALYEQGMHPDLSRTPLSRGASMGVHESQSRLMENIVGRSRGFWRAHFPTLQSHFPDQLGAANLEHFYRAINKVQPSLIRVEADEVTYNLHIVLRFELEQALLNGELAVADLPAAWNDKMNELLGVAPPTDTLGVLQDIHWTAPSFGYFPTYALGNLYAAQFAEAAQQQPAIREELANGQTAALLAWLRENIHQHGHKLTPGELITRATGRPLSPAAFVAYVNSKFSEIYAL